mgnify:CR=1 FL=1
MASATKIKGKIQRALKKLGATAVFVVESGGIYDVTTGLFTGQTSVEVSVLASPPVDYRTIYKDPQKEGRSLNYISTLGLSFTPVLNQSFTLRGKIWKIQQITDYTINDEVVGYELEVIIG